MTSPRATAVRRNCRPRAADDVDPFKEGRGSKSFRAIVEATALRGSRAPSFAPLCVERSSRAAGRSSTGCSGPMASTERKKGGFGMLDELHDLAVPNPEEAHHIGHNALTSERDGPLVRLALRPLARL